MLSRTLPVPLSVTVAETAQESGSVKGRTRLSVTGVCAVEPPVTLALEPDSVQVADQAMVASWASPAVSFAPTEMAAGVVVAAYTANPESEVARHRAGTICRSVFMRSLLRGLNNEASLRRHGRRQS